ncbi:unnamed protein product [Amoebophrya sp. A120]|nr:unnamed protein product [Amoebophrya sp. A120]|eukprot:GSA120T00022156001.1
MPAKSKVPLHKLWKDEEMRKFDQLLEENKLSYEKGEKMEHEREAISVVADPQLMTLFGKIVTESEKSLLAQEHTEASDHAPVDEDKKKLGVYAHAMDTICRASSDMVRDRLKFAPDPSAIKVQRRYACELSRAMRTAIESDTAESRLERFAADDKAREKTATLDRTWTPWLLDPFPSSPRSYDSWTPSPSSDGSASKKCSRRWMSEVDYYYFFDFLSYLIGEKGDGRERYFLWERCEVRKWYIVSGYGYKWLA